MAQVMFIDVYNDCIVISTNTKANIDTINFNKKVKKKYVETIKNWIQDNKNLMNRKNVTVNYQDFEADYYYND